VLYMTQKRPEAAMELFVKAMAIQDGYVDPYYNLACLYSQSGNVRASLSYLERAVKIDGQVRKWAKQDNDFKKMQSLPEFHKITEELVK
jgi:tetratricopeptide (TPR) repeat protein